MLRLILGSIAGYIVVAVCTAATFIASGHDPHAPQPIGFVVMTSIVGIVAALIGGNVAARISRRAAGGVAGLIAIGAILSMATSGDTNHWSQIVAIVLMAPAALLGGRFVARRDPATGV